MKSFKFLAGVAIVGALAASAANAKVYDFSFNASNGDNVFGKFTTDASNDVISATGNTYLPVLDNAACCGFVNNGFTLAGGSNPSSYLTPSGKYQVDNIYPVDYFGLYLTTFNDREINVYAGTMPTGYSSETVAAGQGAKPAYVGIYDPSTGLDAQESGTLTISAVPEPATWAMLIMGAGMTGALLRRRNAVVAA